MLEGGGATGGGGGGEKKQKRRKKAKVDSYAIYINRVSQSLHSQGESRRWMGASATGEATTELTCARPRLDLTRQVLTQVSCDSRTALAYTPSFTSSFLLVL